MKKLLSFLIIFLLVVFTWNVIIGHSIMFRPFFEKTENVPSFEIEKRLLQGTEGKSSFQTDRNGLNNDDSLYQKEGCYSVIVLGDSYTESLQVERKENFCSLLMQKMNKNSFKCNIFNLGISGLSLADYIAFADRYKKEYNPDLLIVQVTESDFFTDATAQYKLIHINSDQNGYFIEENESYEGGLQKLLTRIYKPLDDRERFLTFLPFLEYSKMKAEQLSSSQIQNHDHTEIKKGKVYNTSLLNWELQRLKEVYKIPVVLLYLPTTPVIANGVVEQTEDLFLPVLSEQVKKYGITLVNLEDSFNENYLLNKTLPRGFNNTAPGEGHLNQTGHALVAQELSKVIPILLQEEENAL